MATPTKKRRLERGNRLGKAKPMADDNTDGRLDTILAAIIEIYIETAEPVGSRTLSRVLDQGLSAATIRNVMADLTELGYLDQPHTSAGRVPTDKAYRFYVDRMEKSTEVPEEIRALVGDTLEQSPAGLDSLLNVTTKMLADMTHFTSIVAAPRSSFTRLKQIEFIRISEHQICVALITQSNLVYNKIIEIPEVLPQAFLNSVSGYLNEQFSQDSLQEIRDKMLGSLLEEKDHYDQLLAQVVRLSKRAFDMSSVRALYVEGQSHIVKGFHDADKIGKLLRMLEEKITILSLLDETIKAPGVNIAIGVENPYEEFQECTVVTAHYGHGDNPLGAIGVIGPTRMNYLEIIPIINFTALSLTAAITNQ